MSYTVKATNSKTKEGKASVPGLSSQNKEFRTGYVRIKANNRSISLEIEERFGAGGNEIWITPNTLGINNNETMRASVEAASENKYRLDRILNTSAGRLALTGLMMAFIGQAIKLSFAIGDTGSVFWIVSANIKSCLIWFSSGLQLFGLLLVFVRGAWFGIK